MALALVSSWATSTPVFAQDEAGAESAPAGEGAGEPEVDPYRFEWVVLPYVTYISEIGLLVGLVGAFTKFDPDADPYVWSVTAAASVGLGLDARGNAVAPLQRFELKYLMPSLLENRLRLNLAGFAEGQSNLGYFGLGNASRNVGNPTQPPTNYTGPDGLFQQYERGFVEVRGDVAYRVTPEWFVTGGLWLHWVDHLPYDDSKLARDQASAAMQSDPTLRGLDAYFGGVLHVGAFVDTRDSELNPNDGVFAEASIRGGVGFGATPNVGWGAFYLNIRGFVNLVDRWLVLALRGVADVGFGDMPLMEMTRLGAYTAFLGIGGEQSNRGLPGGRLIGRVRFNSNAELRLTFWRIVTGRGVPLFLGAIAFTDVSHVRSRLVDADPELGEDFFLWTSVGGGLRFGWGEATTLRLDVGVAPVGGEDRSPSVGFAFSAGHMF